MLREFIDAYFEDDAVAKVRADLIGEGLEIEGPEGRKLLLYADYAASGRALKSIESFVQEKVLPFYANAHTEASYCGAYVNRLRGEARAIIASSCCSNEEHVVIFAGAGATAGLNRLAKMLIPAHPNARTRKPIPLVLVGPYEHHSNILPWRESGADIVDIPEAIEGGPDCGAIEAALRNAGVGSKVIGAFSAASNVTGIITDIERVNGLLKRYGAISVWDFAAGAPYLPIDMKAGGGLDAIVFSPHKFIGGPGASGVLIVKKTIVPQAAPSITGGGTVSFVSPWSHHYVAELGAREEAGTPNVLGDIRAALVMLVKERIHQAYISARDRELCRRAREAWGGEERIEVLGNLEAQRLPIFSFRVRDGNGGHVHQQLVTRMLSDYYGVQARGGCACAGPYAHRLLGIDRDASETLWSRLEAGHELEKPGWTRVNLCAVASDEQIGAILHAVSEVAERAPELAGHYACDAKTARFRHL
jgi:selenocysteine lyase/cysteine desulfurase